MNQSNDVLSLCIPTYNRSARLAAGLKELVPKASKYNVAIYISDNASTDDTEKTVNNYKSQYEHIYYHRNETNLGYDGNFENVLKMTRSRYAWLLSDDDRIVSDGIDCVLAALNGSDLDLLLVNGGLAANSSASSAPEVEGRVVGVKDRLYGDQSLFMADLGWHLTWISCLVFSRKMIDDGRFAWYRGTCLTHVGTIFEYLSRVDIKVRWIATPLVYGIDGGKPAWQKKALEIFGKNWYEIITTQAGIYSTEAKYKCILDHGVKSGLFNSVNSFVHLRINNAFNFRQLVTYAKYFRYITRVSRFILLAISLAPVGLLVKVKKIIRDIRVHGERA